MNKNNLNVGDGKEEAMKIKKKPLRVLEMMKGGIRDRPLASWIRILVVAVLWWTFIIAFMAGCYALMYTIIYGSEEDKKAPYFVRNPNKYPDILPQPGIKIDCAEKSCTVSLNRIVGWTPEPWDTATDSPTQTLYDDRTLDMKAQLKVVGRSENNAKNVGVVVTCYGADKKDADLLKGMKQDKAGFPKEAFPWTGEDNTKEDDRRKLTLDLSKTAAITGGKEEEVKLFCQAWAKNIDTERGYLDKSRPNGGGGCMVYFKDGQVNKDDQDGCNKKD